MSTLGDASLAQTPVFPKDGSRRASQSQEDEEEQLMEGCYRDTDFGENKIMNHFFFVHSFQHKHRYENFP